ncbi:MAG: DUF4832 domain-containing protein [Paludibacteraceae bacterium]|nr:DUF4832 domain-containing protein [Paludibacteraceae bacterium]
MRKTVLSLCAMLLAVVMNAATVTYVADDNTMILNPERGFYHYSDIRFNGDGTGGLTNRSDAISACKRDQVTLLFRYFYMNKYNDGSPITNKDLQLIANDFEVARNNGLKVIVRFSYGSQGYKSDNNWSFTEPSKQGMLAHMAQLKPVLAANADVIACVQAGFVGIWGEWYFSSTFGKDWSKPNAVSDRNDIINGLLDMTPADRCVQLRTVHYITEYIGNGKRDYETQLTDQTAFNGSAQARLAHHNDAFAANSSNDGTYYDAYNERPYLANLGQYVPLGGENNGGEAPYNTGARAMADMQTLHYDFLNMDYDLSVLRTWKNTKPEGSSLSHYETMQRCLGYRLQMRSVTLPDSIDPKYALPVRFIVYNAGFSNLYNRRIAYIVLKGNGETHMLPLQSDPRRWKSGQETGVVENLPLPQNMANGLYHVYFYMPDVYESIAADPAYAVRLANQNMNWIEGMNDLNMTVEIKDGVPFDALDKVVSSALSKKYIKNHTLSIHQGKHVYSALGQTIR